MSQTEPSIHPAESLPGKAFTNAAKSIVTQIQRHGFAEYVLVPGDATMYRFIFLAPGRNIAGSTEDVRRWQTDWMVMLCNFGLGYPWGGQHMHWDYCSEKWTKDRNEYTGRIVARLLNAVSDEWAHVDNGG